MKRIATIQQDIKLHNEFLFDIVEYTDKTCLKVLKKYQHKAFNIIVANGLNNMIRHLSNGASNGTRVMFSSDTYHSGIGNVIHYGSSNTAPSINDTAMGSPIGSKVASYHAKELNTSGVIKWCSYTQKVVITPSEHVGSTFREVGLHNGQELNTRALIVDSEGTPISIVKTATMQITIYAKFYMTLPAIGIDNATWASAAPVDGSYATAGNSFLYNFYNNMAGFSSSFFVAGTSNDAPAYTDPCVKTHLQTISPHTIVRDEANYKATITARFETNQGNGKIKELGHKRYMMKSSTFYSHSTWRLVLPSVGVFEYSEFTDHQIGIGDGATTDFTLTEVDNTSASWLWNEIISGSLKVYIDDVETTAFTYNDTTGTVSLTVAPATDEVITATWRVPYIAKSNDYVVDVEFVITAAQGTIPS